MVSSTVFLQPATQLIKPSFLLAISSLPSYQRLTVSRPILLSAPNVKPVLVLSLRKIKILKLGYARFVLLLINCKLILGFNRWSNMWRARLEKMACTFWWIYACPKQNWQQSKKLYWPLSRNCLRIFSLDC